MTDQVKEQVSALLDGELPSGECSLLLRRLSKEREFGDAAGRYLLIGEAMRAVKDSSSVCSPTRGFADRVMAALDEEAAQPDEQVDGAASRSAHVRRASTARWLKTGGGLAIAASVGAAAVLFVQLPPAAKLAPVTAAAVSTSATREVSEQKPVQFAEIGLNTSSSQQFQSRPEDRNGDMGIREVASTAPVYSNGRLTNYVVAHSEYSSPLGRRNVLTGILAEDADLQESSPGTAPVSWATR
jgi:sigma-E factor negative regulatory protein RseA